MIEQRSAEWFEQRRGKPTASQFSKVLTSKGYPSKSQDDYAADLLLDRLGYPKPAFDNPAMAVGREREPLAVLAFEIQTGIDTQEAPFILHESGRWGASPDRLIDDSAILEIKCPMEKTHLKNLDRQEIPSHYFPQVQGQMIVSGVDTGWFMSYHPDHPSMIVRVDRDIEWCDKFIAEVSSFCDRLDLMEVGARVLTNFLKG